MKLNRTILLLPLLNVAIVLASCTTATPYRFQAANGEVADARSGELVVPENRSDPHSRMIRLRYVLFPSTNTQPGSPIVYLAGGPGGSGIAAARGSRFPLFMALRKYGDVIAFDQRGTGRSEPELDCSEPYALPFDEPLDFSKAGTVLASATRRCAERLTAEGVDLAGYDTLDSAADLEDLRIHLGAEKLTLWGISYGTHLALATIRAYPASIDRAILAGVEPLRHTLKLPSDQQTLLEEIARRAASDPDVGDSYPNLLETIRSTISRLEREPTSAALADPTSGQLVNVVVGADDLRHVLASLLTGPESFQLLPDLVARIHRGDWTALALSSARQRFGNPGNMMAIAMDCASGASVSWLERIEHESETTLLRDAINFPLPELCAGLPLTDLGDEFREPVESDIPVLLISGTLDGRTPVANAEFVATHFPKSRQLVIEGAGHSDPLFLSSPEILRTMERFLRGEQLEDRRVIESQNPVRFLAPRNVADLTPDELSRYGGNYQIAEGDVRRVIPAGSVLFTIRNDSPPFALRPTSETEFFYEGLTTRVVFELDATGRPSAMVAFTEDHPEGQRAVRVE